MQTLFSLPLLFSPSSSLFFSILLPSFTPSLSHKYVLAYLPVVAFYYRGRVLFKFKLSASYEELRDTVANITGLGLIFHYAQASASDHCHCRVCAVLVVYDGDVCCWQGTNDLLLSASISSALPGFTPRQLNISDAENAFPVPTERSNGDRYILYLATGWLVFVSVVCALRSSWAARLALQCRERLLNRRTAAAAAD